MAKGKERARDPSCSRFATFFPTLGRSRSLMRYTVLSSDAAFSDGGLSRGYSTKLKWQIKLNNGG